MPQTCLDASFVTPALRHVFDLFAGDPTSASTPEGLKAVIDETLCVLDQHQGDAEEVRREEQFDRLSRTLPGIPAPARAISRADREFRVHICWLLFRRRKKEKAEAAQMVLDRARKLASEQAASASSSARPNRRRKRQPKDEAARRRSAKDEPVEPPVHPADEEPSRSQSTSSWAMSRTNSGSSTVKAATAASSVTEGKTKKRRNSKAIKIKAKKADAIRSKKELRGAKKKPLAKKPLPKKEYATTQGEVIEDPIPPVEGTKSTTPTARRRVKQKGKHQPGSNSNHVPDEPLATTNGEDSGVAENGEVTSEDTTIEPATADHLGPSNGNLDKPQVVTDGETLVTLTGSEGSAPLAIKRQLNARNNYSALNDKLLRLIGRESGIPVLKKRRLGQGVGRGVLEVVSPDAEGGTIDRQVDAVKKGVRENDLEDVSPGTEGVDAGPNVIAAKRRLTGPRLTDISALSPQTPRTNAKAPTRPPALLPTHKDPAPPTRPPVWAQSRQELCEALPYYRAFQSGMYMHKRVPYGYLLDGFPAPRDVWAADGRIIISHGGGQSVRIMDAHGRPTTSLAADHTRADARIDTLLQAAERRAPVILLAGEGYALLPWTLGCAYAVLGWYWVSEAWYEPEPCAPGITPPAEGRDWFRRLKVRFDWVEGQGEPWWLRTGEGSWVPPETAKAEPGTLTRGTGAHGSALELPNGPVGEVVGACDHSTDTYRDSQTSHLTMSAASTPLGFRSPPETSTPLEAASPLQAGNARDDDDLVARLNALPRTASWQANRLSISNLLNSEPPEDRTRVEASFGGSVGDANSHRVASPPDAFRDHLGPTLPPTPDTPDQKMWYKETTHTPVLRTLPTPPISPTADLDSPLEDVTALQMQIWSGSGMFCPMVRAPSGLFYDSPSTSHPSRTPGEQPLLNLHDASECFESNADASPHMYDVCDACSGTSPWLYTEGWACLDPECTHFWMIETAEGFYRIPPHTSLEYDANFLVPAPTPPQARVVPFSVVPPLPRGSSEASEGTDGVAGSRALWTGWVCDACGRANCRYRWEVYECRACGRQFAPLDRDDIVPALALRRDDPDILGEADEGHPHLPMSTRRIPGQATVVAYDLPNAGTVYHVLHDGHAAADAIWTAYQRAAIETTDPLFQRRALKANIVKGQLLSQQFAINSGASYKYIVETLSYSFAESPPCVMDALELIRSRVANVLGERVEFNEILSVMYREGQKMSWHDDGEDGLGPVVAALSLGASAVMSFRPKTPRFHTDMIPTVGAGGKLDKGAKPHKAPPVLNLMLSHGDVVIMAGRAIQYRYDHRVVPEGMRVAATARVIGAEA